MRKFTSTEVATLLGVTEAYIRQVAAKEQGPEPEIANGRRFYTLEQVLELRMALAANGRKKWMNPRRTGDEQCQIVAVTNFKGGSSKTSTTIHLGHYLALKGYRVLAVDLDPKHLSPRSMVACRNSITVAVIHFSQPFVSTIPSRRNPSSTRPTSLVSTSSVPASN